MYYKIIWIEYVSPSVHIRIWPFPHVIILFLQMFNSPTGEEKLPSVNLSGIRETDAPRKDSKSLDIHWSTLSGSKLSEPCVESPGELMLANSCLQISDVYLPISTIRSHKLHSFVLGQADKLHRGWITRFPGWGLGWIYVHHVNPDIFCRKVRLV